MVLAANAGTATAGVIVAVVAAIAQIVLFVAGVVSVIRSPGLGGTGRLLWILGMLIFPLLGPIVWFAYGRHHAGGPG